MLNPLLAITYIWTCTMPEVLVLICPGLSWSALINWINPHLHPKICHTSNFIPQPEGNPHIIHEYTITYSCNIRMLVKIQWNLYCIKKHLGWDEHFFLCLYLFASSSAQGPLPLLTLFPPLFAWRDSNGVCSFLPPHWSFTWLNSLAWQLSSVGGVESLFCSIRVWTDRIPHLPFALRQ